MSNTPSDIAFTDGSAISKSAVRALFNGRVPLRLANAAELRALTTGGAATYLLASLNQFWFCDPADTTSADNGSTVIVSADGYRYKPIVPSVPAGSIGAAQLAAGAVGTAALASGAVQWGNLSSGLIAQDSDAQAGTATNLLMTPETTAAAIATRVSGGIVGSPQIITSPVADVRFAFPAAPSPFAYRAFTISLYNVAPVANASLYLVFSQDNGATWIGGANQYESIPADASASTQGIMGLLYACSPTAGYEISGDIRILGPLDSGTRKDVVGVFVYRDWNGTYVKGTGAGVLLSTTSACNMAKIVFLDNSFVQKNISRGTFFMTGTYF